MAYEERIRTRLREKIWPDPFGTVELKTIVALLDDFRLSRNEVGKYLKAEFPQVKVRRGRANTVTLYTGVSLSLPVPAASSRRYNRPLARDRSLLSSTIGHVSRQPSLADPTLTSTPTYSSHISRQPSLADPTLTSTPTYSSHISRQPSLADPTLTSTPTYSSHISRQPSLADPTLTSTPTYSSHISRQPSLADPTLTSTPTYSSHISRQPSLADPTLTSTPTYSSHISRQPSLADPTLTSTPTYSSHISRQPSLADPTLTSTPTYSSHISRQHTLTPINHGYSSHDVTALIEENRMLRAQLYEARQAAAILDQSTMEHRLHMEISALCSNRSPLSASIRTVSDIQLYSIQDTTSYIKTQAPTIYHLISNLVSPTYTRSTEERSHSVAALVISTIANHHSHKTTGLQTILSLGFMARTCNDQLLTILNHAGMTVSPSTTSKIIKQNADEMRSTPIPSEGQIWAYDNLNIMVRVQQMRKGLHGEMMNWTSRITIPLRYFPDAALSTEPLGRRRDLRAADLLPNQEDMTMLKRRLASKVKSLLCADFTRFQVHYKPQPNKAVPKSSYRPLELMKENEAKTSDNIVILRRFASDAGMTPENCWDQEIVGDQATCKNIRGARRFRQNDINPLEQLTWPKECPGDFHFLWEDAKCVVMTYWSSPRNAGSLGHLRDLVDRRNVDSLGKNFNATDEFLHHACKAHLTAALLQHLGMQSVSEDLPGMSEEDLDEIIDSFLDTYVLTPPDSVEEDDAVFKQAKAHLTHLLMYTDLRQCIRNEDGPAVVSHWRLWLPTFLGTNRTQYSTEAANHLANMKADWSPKTTYVLTHNRFYNTHGRHGHAKPVDMLVEHYNKILKKALKSSGGRLTLRHAQEVSLAVPLLDEARRFCDGVFRARKTVSHTSPSADADVQSMIQAISEEKVYSPTAGRRLFFGKDFKDVTQKGWKRVTADKWLDNFLQKGVTDVDEDEDGVISRDEEEEDDAVVDFPALMDE
ncbi:uncharacterized protein [Branchiostoma lanceolatum]|uniref:uncharacterized protein n=1 Tax=Branchiostoma lanceolatum TaxID=7740 RepID=UPI00345556F3